MPRLTADFLLRRDARRCHISAIVTPIDAIASQKPFIEGALLKMERVLL